MGAIDTFKIVLPQNLLQEENNLIITPSAGKAILNWIEVDYKRLYKPEKDYIEFVAPDTGVYKFYIGPFTNPNLTIWQLGVRIIEGAKIISSGTDFYLSFEDTIFNKSAKYCAFSSSALKKPLNISKVQTSNLRDLDCSALIITNSSLYTCAQRYSEFWRTNGVNCKPVTVEEIYNEFNSGLPDPIAIKNFLSYAYENWTTPLVYVVLLGDGSADYKNILGYDECIVPTHISYQTSREEKILVPDDNFYGRVSGSDFIPDIFIGRIPIKDENEFEVVFTKIKSYVENPSYGEWRRKMLFSVGPVMPYESSLFPSLSNALIKDCVPYTYDVNRIYWPQQARRDLLNAFEQGAIYLSYIGHSSSIDWAGGLLRSRDIEGLTNISRLPFITMVGCYNCSFEEIGASSMGELFVKSPGGAIGYWGSAGIAEMSLSHIKTILNLFLDKKVNSLGALVTAGIISLFPDQETIKQYTFLGDPMIELPLLKETITSKIKPSSISPGDLVTISGKTENINSGQCNISLYTPDTIHFKKISTQIINNTFETSVKIPDTIANGDGAVKFYAHDNTSEEIGVNYFTIQGTNIVNIELVPPEPTRKDSILIRANIFDPNGINMVSCTWGNRIDELINVISMHSPLGKPYYETDEPIPPQSPGDTLFYRIQGQNALGESFSSAIRKYKIPLMPDIRPEDEFVLTGKKQVLLTRKIYNAGDETAQSFTVDFYAIDTLGTEIFLGTDTLTLLGKETKTATVPWNLKKGSAYLIIDKNHIIEESDTTNNITEPVTINVTLFNITKEAGSSGWIKSLDDKVSVNIGSNSVISDTVLEITEQGDGYFIGLPEQNEGKLLKPMTIIIQEDTLPIYRLCNGYSRWVFISPDTIGRTKNLGIFKKMVKDDFIPPRITLDLKPSPEEIELRLSDPAGIDIVEKGITIICDNDTLPDTMFSYPEDPDYIEDIPVILKSPFTEKRKYTLKIICYDFNGNKKVLEEDYYPFGLKIEKIANYPNPARKKGTTFYIKFSKPPNEMSLKIYTTSGRLIRTFTEFLPSSVVRIYWDLTDEDGHPCANGVYYARVYGKYDKDTDEKIMKIAILR